MRDSEKSTRRIPVSFVNERANLLLYIRIALARKHRKNTVTTRSRDLKNQRTG